MATNREDMEGASPPVRSVAKTTKLVCKFQAAILNRLKTKWRALVWMTLISVPTERVPQIRALVARKRPA
jgi:hypothetical protein